MKMGYDLGRGRLDGWCSVMSEGRWWWKGDSSQLAGASEKTSQGESEDQRDNPDISMRQ